MQLSKDLDIHLWDTYWRECAMNMLINTKKMWLIYYVSMVWDVTCTAGFFVWVKHSCKHQGPVFIFLGEIKSFLFLEPAIVVTEFAFFNVWTSKYSACIHYEFFNYQCFSVALFFEIILILVSNISLMVFLN